jgi:hypothetical protein
MHCIRCSTVSRSALWAWQFRYFVEGRGDEPMACWSPEWLAESFSWQLAFTDVPDQRLYIVKSMCIYTHIWLRRDCVWITGDTNNTASETFLHKSGAARSVDWIFYHWGYGLVVTGRIRDIGQKVLQYFFFQKGSSSSPSYCHIFILITFLDLAFVRNIMQ